MRMRKQWWTSWSSLGITTAFCIVTLSLSGVTPSLNGAPSTSSVTAGTSPSSALPPSALPPPERTPSGLAPLNPTPSGGASGRVTSDLAPSDSPAAARPGAGSPTTPNSRTRTAQQVPTENEPGSTEETQLPQQETVGPLSEEPEWTPPSSLPAAAPDDAQVLVVLSPHPDDEPLSLGVRIADAEARGVRVIVVALTDGRTTGAVAAVSARLRRKVSQDEIGAARLRELRQAAAHLGVAATDVYPARLDGETTPGGSRITPGEVTAVVQSFAERFPQATFATMSYVAEKHSDHLAAGRALQAAAKTGVVRHVEFAVSRLWWALPSPAVSDVLPASPTVRQRVITAARSYGVWDPAQRRYSIGWLSVRSQFLSLLADPRNRLHGAGPVQTATHRIVR
jgi:LmbE family N-acetylglucosaminyl deacetylase